MFNNGYWPVSRETGTISKIENEKQSKNGPFIIFELMQDTGVIRRIQAWDNAYNSLKYGNFKLGSSVDVNGYLHFYDGQDGKKRIAIKASNIFPRGSKACFRLLITSDWYKGKSIGKEYQAFSGKIMIPTTTNTPSKLTAHVYMKRTNILWRLIKKDNIIDVTGTYRIENDDIGSRIIIDNVYHIREVK